MTLLITRKVAIQQSVRRTGDFRLPWLVAVAATSPNGDRTWLVTELHYHSQPATALSTSLSSTSPLPTTGLA